ncbi:acyl-CoA thioesterase [Coralloluteibacterium thermophilus]|uniref:Acyl-CoA thioesterase n=1 Tax=Coralloluteibacterium thermophilum TaxID=2707049 RepID=A0ABV9NIA8_9GAMM
MSTDEDKRNEAKGRKDEAAKPRRAPRKRVARKPADAAPKAGAATQDASPAPAPAATTAPAPAPVPAPPAGAAAAAPQRVVLTRMPLPVRWRDLDAFNHVNNSNFLTYLEEARVRWLTGLAGDGLDGQVLPLMAAARLNYRRPIPWPADVVVELHVERLGTTSVTIGHRIVAADDDAVLYCDGDVTMVWVDLASGKPAPLPALVRTACGG